MLKNSLIFCILAITIRIIEANDLCKQDAVQLTTDFQTCCHHKYLSHLVSERCVAAMMKNQTFLMECLVDCLYKENEIDDGVNINMDAAKRFLDDHMDSEMVELFLNGFRACNALGRETVLQRFAFDKYNHEKCDVFPAIMDRCVSYHMLSHCPEEMGGFHYFVCPPKINWVRQCMFFENM